MYKVRLVHNLQLLCTNYYLTVECCANGISSYAINGAVACTIDQENFVVNKFSLVTYDDEN